MSFQGLIAHFFLFLFIYFVLFFKLLKWIYYICSCIMIIIKSDKNLFTRKAAEAADLHGLFPCLPVFMHFCCSFLFPWRLDLLYHTCWFPCFQSSSPGCRPSLWVGSCRFASGLTWTQVGNSDHICTWSTLLLLHGSFLTPNSLLRGRDSSFHCRDPLIYEGNELASWHRAVIRYHFRTLRWKTRVFS